MQTTTLRPGYLISLKTSVVGNVQYRKRDIETDHVTEEGMKRATWETERTIIDPVEHEEAVKVRGKARSLITGVCAASAFGLLCPEEAGAQLEEAIGQARQLANEFNARAGLTQIAVYVIAGRVAADDVEAVRAINSEVRDLLSAIESGLENLDVKLVREACNKAREIGTMLSPAAAERIAKAVAVARSAARRIVKAGEEGAAEIDRAAIRAVTESRTALLDLDEAVEMVEPEAVGRAIDLMPEAKTEELEGEDEAGEAASVMVTVPRGWDFVDTSTEDTKPVSKAAAPVFQLDL